MNNPRERAYRQETKKAVDPPGAEAGSVESPEMASDREDRALVAQVLSGDDSAYDRLFGKYRDRVYRVVYHVLRHREDALEGTQEVFVKVYRALNRFDPSARFLTWVYRIARNQAIDQLRRRGIRKEHTYDESNVPLPAPRRSVAGELDRSQMAARIEDAIAALSEKHQAVFRLYSYEELSYSEIAEVLEVPIGTVMSRLFYARKKVKERLPADWDPGGPRRREDRRG